MITAWFLIGAFFSMLYFTIFSFITRFNQDLGIVISIILTTILSIMTWFVFSLI
ncbi:MAG: hypothetical protein IH845_05695 [Nanoarchaeota archaeon]|nr:hypothetical protein [Nanoarchaeota archaeon]